jgi:hypothetical protein
MARRAALIDARRNLLAEAKRIAGGSGKGNISGHIGPHRIISEKIEGNMYKMEIAALLDDVKIYN